MRPLHKKLVDQFFVMKSSLGIQVCTLCIHCGHLRTTAPPSWLVSELVAYPTATSSGLHAKLHDFSINHHMLPRFVMPFLFCYENRYVTGGRIVLVLELAFQVSG